MDEHERAILEFLRDHQETTVYYSGRGIGGVRQLAAAGAESEADRLICPISALDALLSRGYILLMPSQRAVLLTDQGEQALEQP